MSLLVRGTYHQIENVRECLKEMAAEEVRSETESSKNSTANRVMEKKIDYEILKPTSSDG